MILELRETLADVLGEIVANERKNHRQAFEEFKSEANATIARLQDTIDQLKQDALAYIESFKPADGRNGTDGLCGAKGEPGEPGSDGEPGRDGRDGLSGVQGFAGADGKDGRDGIDGFGFDDLACNYDGMRTFTITFIQGERSKEFSFKMPYPLDQGVFRAGTGYDRGDSVTYGGSCWIAQKEAPDGKPGESPDWRLSTKHGRDGKQGERGLPGKDGKDGRPGRDLTQLGPDGSKW